MRVRVVIEYNSDEEYKTHKLEMYKGGYRVDEITYSTYNCVKVTYSGGNVNLGLKKPKEPKIEEDDPRDWNEILGELNVPDVVNEDMIKERERFLKGRNNG